MNCLSVRGIVFTMVALLSVLAFNTGVTSDRLSAQEATYGNVGSDIVFSVQNYNVDGQTPSPYLVKGIEIDGKQIPLNTPVHVTGHWLAHLTVTAQNVSVKDIVESQLTLVFPETGNGTRESPVFTTGTSIGIRPEAALYRRDGTKSPRAWWEASQAQIDIPSKKMMIFVLDDKYNDQEHAYKQSGGQITRVILNITRVWFNDDTRWMSGIYTAPASGLPGEWSTVSADQFVQRP